MIDTKALREKVLDLAIRGKLVPQDPNDEPASALLERIRAEKEQMVKDGKLKAKDIKNDTIIFKGDDNLHYEQFLDGTVKCIEDEIPFDLPSSWVWTRLGTLSFAIQYGLSNSAEQDGTHRLLRITDIQDGKVNWDSVPFTTVNESENYLLSTGDIVFARTGATVGKSFLIEETPYPSVYASYLIRIRLLNDIIPEYIYQFFNSECYWEQITDKSVGVGQPNVNGTSLKNLLVPLAPMDEQKRIVPASRSALKIVLEIDKNSNELLSTIASLKSKVLDLAIRGQLVPQNPDDEPASVLLGRIRAEKEELIKQGKIKRDKKESVIFKGEDNSYYEEIPGNWICCNVKSVMQYIRNGATIKQSKDATGIPITRIETISQEFIDYTKMGYANIFEVDNYQSFVLNSGDILMSHINSPKHLCKCAIYNHTEKNEVVLHGMNLLSLRPVVHETSKFLLYMFRSSEFKAYVYENMKHSVNQASITATDIGNYTFLLPPLAEQKRIVEAIKIAFAQLDEILNSIS